MTFLQRVRDELGVRAGRLVDSVERRPKWQQTAWAFATLASLGAVGGQLWSMSFGQVVVTVGVLFLAAVSLARWRWGFPIFLATAGVMWIYQTETRLAALLVTAAAICLGAMFTLPVRPTSAKDSGRVPPPVLADPPTARLKSYSVEQALRDAHHLPALARTFAEVTQGGLWKAFPVLSKARQSDRWTFFCSIAGAWTACAVLHHVLPDPEDRTLVEMTVRSDLAAWYVAADAAFDNLGEYVGQAVSPIAEPRRRDALRAAVGQWVVSSLTGGRPLDREREIVAHVSTLIEREFGGYWDLEVGA